jgi:hypothetical protein
VIQDSNIKFPPPPPLFVSINRTRTLQQLKKKKLKTLPFQHYHNTLLKLDKKKKKKGQDMMNIDTMSRDKRELYYRYTWVLYPKKFNKVYLLLLPNKKGCIAL